MTKLSGLLLIILAFCTVPINSFADISYFTKAYNSRGNYKDAPGENGNIEILNIEAAQNEYEPVLLLMRSEQKHNGLAVKLGGPLKCGSNSINKENVDIRQVASFKHWLNPRRFMRFPYLLGKNKSFDLQPNRTARIWITVYVPVGTEPGTYTSLLDVIENEKVVKKIELKLKVWPFRLKTIESSEMMYGMYWPTYHIPEWGRSADYLAKCYTDMKKHGMNMVGAHNYISHGNIFTSVRKGHWLTLGTHLKAIRKSKILSPGGIYISMCGKMLGIDKLRELVKILRDEKFNVKLYGIDEPGLEKYRQDLTRKVIPKLKEAAPDVPVITAICTKGIASVGDYYDDWIFSAWELNDQIREQAEKAGKTLYSYDCGTAAVDPLVSRFYWGLFVWRVQFKGAMQWAYGERAVNRYNAWQEMGKEFDPSMDYLYSFVCLTPEGPQPTVAWENIREGIDDYRYISQLQDLIKEARSKGKKAAADEAEKILKELHDKIDPENYRKAFLEGEKYNGLRGSAYNRGNPEPNLTPEDYNIYRRRIAEAIIRLNKELEK